MLHLLSLLLSAVSLHDLRNRLHARRLLLACSDTRIQY